MGKYSEGEARAIVTARVGEGVEFLEDYPNSVSKKWSMLCPKGHPCCPQLRSVISGQGICLECRAAYNSGNNRLTDAEARARVLAIYPDAIISEPYPDGNDRPWSMTCPVGHNCTPTFASIQQGRSMCAQCSKDAVAARLALSDEDARARVLRHHGGVTFLVEYPSKNNLPWPMLCPNGHECSPTLSQAMRVTHGICPDCAHSGFKNSQPAHLYVLVGSVGPHAVQQFGISNAKSLASRLGKHSRSGFTNPPVRLLTFDTGAEARRVEAAVVQLMRSCGVPSCHSLGIRFDGSTESFLVSAAHPDFTTQLDALLSQNTV